MDRKIKIGLVQFEGRLGEVQENVFHARKLIAEGKLKGADILCFPELFATGYNLSVLGEKTISLGNEYYDFIVSEMSESAHENQIHLIVPIGRKTSASGILANSALIFDNKGKLAGYFDKTHLWALEAMYYKEGNSYPVFELNFSGGPVKVGLMICYDAGFPEACRSLSLNGAELVFCPSAWRIQDMDMWDLNVAQRALENLLFVAGVNRFGHEEDLYLFGKSKVCNPRGTVIAELPMDREAVEVVEIDLGDIERFRTEIPYLRDRKPYIYESITNFS
ncbi:MAG: carbon-nitrogen hydrolase [Dethiosulfovibrio peptidovorans]|nr:MAG: carbon-nitrogen hydrolase [Dethiosulfovibrio peptidovorans]